MARSRLAIRQRPVRAAHVATSGSREHALERRSIGRVAEFVLPDFDVPLGIETSEFVLEPLGPEHNDQDYNAWTSSMEHIAATPGFP